MIQLHDDTNADLYAHISTTNGTTPTNESQTTRLHLRIHSHHKIEGSTPPNEIEVGKHTTESNERAILLLETLNQKFEIPNLNNLNPNSVFTKVI